MIETESVVPDSSSRRHGFQCLSGQKSTSFKLNLAPWDEGGRSSLAT